MEPRPLIAWVGRTPLRRLLAALAGLVAVLAVGLLDYVTGSGISFAGFYVLVIVPVTVVGGPVAGGLAAVASAGVGGGRRHTRAGPSPASPCRSATASSGARST